jgi:hypothetical protein
MTKERKVWIILQGPEDRRLHHIQHYVYFGFSSPSYEINKINKNYKLDSRENITF